MHHPRFGFLVIRLSCNGRSPILQLRRSPNGDGHLIWCCQASGVFGRPMPYEIPPIASVSDSIVMYNELIAAFPKTKRTCVLCGRSAKQAKLRHLRTCYGCNLVMYCSKECHDAHWPTHKSFCRAYKEATVRSQRDLPPA